MQGQRTRGQGMGDTTSRIGQPRTEAKLTARRSRIVIKMVEGVTRLTGGRYEESTCYARKE